ncbi:helix-turn-helix transcriptional regulator [Kitasatospora cineracea]|uniref:helix-turn-helix domain-containing protein n=1 Tax=Kitasatospora cineracea TaxID=88074 RepID=UPI0034378419
MARGMADFDGDALRRFRASAARTDRAEPGLSAAELATRAGTTKAQVLAYEQGRQTPEPQRIRRLAEVLGIHPSVLTSRSDDFRCLAELRRSYGYRASDVVNHLAVSPKVYRRFEAEGLSPSRRPTLIFEVASFLGITSKAVDRVLVRSPAVTERLEHVAEILQSLRLRHASNPQPWTPPRPEDELIGELAATMARSPAAVGRVMTLIMADERRRMMRMDRETVTLMFELDQHRRAESAERVERSITLSGLQMDQLPGRLDGFFRFALSPALWSALTRTPDQWTPLNRTGISQQTLRALPAELVARHVDEAADRTDIILTRQGTTHVRTFKRWYGALHPGVRTGPARATRPSAPRR